MPPPEEDDPYAALEAPEEDAYEELSVSAPSADVDLDRPEDVQGLEAVPTGYRETGRVHRQRRNRTLVMPTMEEVVDPTGRTRGSHRLVGEAHIEETPEIEYREIAKDPEYDRLRREGMARQIEREHSGGSLIPNITPGGALGLPLEILRQLEGAEFAGRELPSARSLHHAMRADDASGFIESLMPTADSDTPVVGSDLRTLAPAYGATDSATLGWIDELMGELSGGTEAEQSAVRDRERRRSHAVEEQAPGAYALGQVGGALPLAAIPGGGQTALGRIASQAALGAGLGFSRGMGESEETDAGERLLDGLTGAWQDGAGAGVLQGAGELATPIMRGLSSLADVAGDAGARARMQASGLNPSPAPRTRYGRHVARLGGPQEVARMLDEERIGGRILPTPSAIPDDVERLGSEAGEALEDVVSQIDAARPEGAIPRRSLVDSIEQNARELEATPTGPSRRGARIARREYIQPHLGEPLPPGVQGPRDLAPDMSFRDAQRLRTRLGDESGAFSRAADPARASQAGIAGDARESLAGLMNEAAEDIDPALREAWRGANQRWSLRELLNENARPGGGLLGPTIAESAALAQGEPLSAIAGRAAQGMASRYGPALRARSLQILAPRLRAMGPAAQRWARVLEAAGSRGSVSLAAAHYTLSRQDPAYRQTVESIQNEEQE